VVVNNARIVMYISKQVISKEGGKKRGHREGERFGPPRGGEIIWLALNQLSASNAIVTILVACKNGQKIIKKETIVQ